MLNHSFPLHALHADRRVDLSIYFMIQNFPYQLRKALDKNTNYSINILETYTLFDYSVAKCILTKFLILLELVMIP